MITQEQAKDAITKLLEEYNISVEKLTKTQTAELILQMIKSGDFLRYVHHDTRSQSINYIPFREIEKLKTKLDNVHRLIDDYIDYRHMGNTGDKDCYENLLDYWRDNIKNKNTE